MRTGEQRFPTWLRTDSASPEVETSVLPPPGGVSASASLRLWPFLSPVSDPLLISQRNPARAGQTTCSTGHLGIQIQARLLFVTKIQSLAKASQACCT